VKTFRFLDFPVYQDSKHLYLTCISITRSFPRQYWELGEQLRRAALSVCLNIAEGSAKYSDKDFKRYLENALGSINESFACLEIMYEHKLMPTTVFSTIQEEATSVAKQLGGLAKKLRSSG